jgi:hypothetical protein
MKIFKYPLAIVDEQRVPMPIGARILSAATQREGHGVAPVERVCLWAEVDPLADRADRTILIRGTGHDAPDAPARFVGTCLQGPFVWHVYEIPEPASFTS